MTASENIIIRKKLALSKPSFELREYCYSVYKLPKLPDIFGFVLRGFFL